MLVQMGGTVKISEYAGEFNSFEDSLPPARSIVDDLFKSQSGKKNIGYNIYFNGIDEKNKASDITSEINKYFSELKKELAGGSSMRIVYPGKNGEISSISISKNNLLKKGVILDFIFLMAG